MVKTNVENPELETLGAEAMTKTEHFFESNGKKIVIAIIAVIAIAVAIFGYKSLVIDPQEDRAVNMIYAAQNVFESSTPDYRVALEGDGVVVGFLDVISKYPSTKTGNIANHYAGICYLKLGDLDNAKRYLTKYKAQGGVPAQIINAQNIGLQGDIAVDQKSYAAAVALFVKAAEMTTNELTTPMYLRKAGMAAQAAGDSAKAKALYQKVIDMYPRTMDAMSAKKLINAI